MRFVEPNGMKSVPPSLSVTQPKCRWSGLLELKLREVNPNLKTGT